MLQILVIQYLRGYEGKPISNYIKKGTLAYKAYKEGKSDRNKNLPNKYLKEEK